MNNVKLKDLVGGALQEKFGRSFERIVENLQDVNTPYKTKRKISITLDFTQDEARDNVNCDISVVEKLAPQSPLVTSFAVGKDLKTGEMYVQEYGPQIRGQMTMEDYVKEESTEEKEADMMTGEEGSKRVVDFRKAAQ